MEKRKFIPAIIFVFILFLSSSLLITAQLTLEKEAIHDVVAKELSQPAEFLVKVKNHADKTDFFEFYTYVNVMISPKGSTTIAANEEKEFILKVYPTEKLRDERKGGYTFVYYMKTSEETQEDRLVIRILPLDEILKIDFPEIITPDISEIELRIENQENIVLDNMRVRVKAAFIDSSEEISFEPFQKKNLALAVDQNKLKNMLAAKYLVKISFITDDGTTVDVIKEIDIREKSNIATTEEEFGSLFYPAVRITKTNDGNIITDVDVIIRRNIFANAFTSFSLKADEVKSSATANTFSWHTTLKPGEKFSVEVRTNYLLPLGILLAIIVATILIMLWLKTSLIIKKKSVRIKSKTGEFAIKVMILVKARENLNNVFIRDRIPRLAELHERYGSIKPSKVHKEKKLIEWHIPHLRKGEEHIISYVIYSKVSILGRFELSKATAIFENEKGEHKKASSNAVFFFSEEKVPM